LADRQLFSVIDRLLRVIRRAGRNAPSCVLRNTM
jgi:hypothetical protein